MRKSGCLFFLFLFCVQLFAAIGDIATATQADTFDLPMRISPVLSANFGELRENHFHSGLDFKTQGVEGKNVYAVADGWVSRICIRNGGYGKAVYIDHFNGYTSVYAHLKELSPRLDSILKDAQYAAQSYEQDLLFRENDIPVSRGERIAWSGNSGSSGGPHLHFEIRETLTEMPVDPLYWYRDSIPDREKPRMLSLAVYAMEGSGVLSSGNGQSASGAQKKIISFPQDNRSEFDKQIPAVWGKIGLGLKAYNYMTDTRNLYGVYRIRLFWEEEEIFCQEINRLSFDESRCINALVDFEEWRDHHSWIMKSFIDGEHFPDIYPLLKDSGIVTIDEEKTYHFRYELSDRNGNVSACDFCLQGKEMPITPADTGKLYMYPAFDNEFVRADIHLDIPQGALYRKLAFEYRQIAPLSPPKPSALHPKSYSDRYKIHRSNTPLYKPISVNLRIQDDILQDKNKYYLALFTPDDKLEYIGGKYENGCLCATLSSFGTYTVLCDTVPPKIIFPDIANAAKNHLLRIIIRDNESGIAGYTGSVDDRWALLEDDYKQESILYRFDARSIQSDGKSHTLTIKVWDHCGNERIEQINFYY